MHLYEVKVIDAVLPRAHNAKVFVQAYVTIAASPLEAAQNVMRENTVHSADRVVVSLADGLTVNLGSRHYYPRDLERFDGERFTGRELAGSRTPTSQDRLAQASADAADLEGTRR